MPSEDDVTVVRGHEPVQPASMGVVLIPLLVGALVAVGLGVFGKVHDPQLFSINIAGFSGPGYVKSWLGTLAAALAIGQVLSALVFYGKFPGVTAPTWIGPVHVWSGRLAVLASIPVAVHCLYALGFQDFDTRVMAHSLFGCFFYGAFTAKMLLLSRKGVPGWALPVVGGLVFTALIGIWLTSSLWFFSNNEIKF